MLHEAENVGETKPNIQLVKKKVVDGEKAEAEAKITRNWLLGRFTNIQ